MAELVPAVIYARYSSSNQREESIEGQLRECHRYAEAHGFRIVKEYTDAAISGRSDARPAFQRMVREAESGAFSALIVWKLDRFARNRHDAAVYRYQLKKSGVKIYSVMEAISDGPEGIILEGLMESLAEYYSANLSQNIKRGCYDAALKRQVFGKPPLGYVKGPDGRYAIDPETAPIVRRIFEEYVSGRSLHQIREGLNADGIRTSRGASFSENSFHRMLKNEKYIGVYEFQDVRDEHGVPPIIDRDLWDAAQSMLSRVTPRRRHQKAETVPEPYLLTTKLFCGHCGSPMTGESGTSKTGQIFRYYSCNGTKSRYRNGCKKRRVPKEWIEAEVVRVLMDEILTDEFIEDLADHFVTAQRDETVSPELEALRLQLADVSKKINNINAAIAAGVWSSSTRDMLIELEATRDALAQKVAELEVRPPELPRSLIVEYLYSVKNGEVSDLRDKLIDLFVRRIYLFDADEGRTRAIFELSMDGADGAPVSRDVVLVFEQSVHSSTSRNLNEHLAVPDRRSVLVAVLLK